MPRVYLPAVASAVLLWTAFFPLDWGPVAAVALVPLLTLVRADVPRRRRYLAAYVGGVAFYGLALNWVRVAHPMMALFAWPGGALYCGLSWPLAVWLLRRLDRAGLPPVVAVPAVWVGLEYLRTHFPTGFPFLAGWFQYQSIGFGWYQLGHAFHRVLPLIQVADLGGVYLLSVGVAAVNAAGWMWLERWRRADRRPPLPELWATAAALCLPAGFVAYGTVRLDHPAFRLGPRVALLQGSVPQDLKMLRDVEPGQLPPLAAEYFELAEQAGAPGVGRAAPDLVVWPETCFGFDWPEGDGTAGPPGFAADAERSRRAVGRRVADLTRTHGLIGLNVLEFREGKGRKFNSAVLVGPDGSARGRYDKIHLVPFGEYVPLKETFPWLQTFTPYRHDYSCTPGESLTRFSLPTADRGDFTFGMMICYEDTDPLFARRYNPGAGGQGVDFLVNTSNDGWFDGTEEHRQHLAICRFRAVECRRSVVRAVNMGVSGVIDPDGRVVKLPVEGDWQASVKVRRVVYAEVPLDTRLTVYAAWGDWVPAGCWLVAAGGCVRQHVRRRTGTVAATGTA